MTEAAAARTAICRAGRVRLAGVSATAPSRRQAGHDGIPAGRARRRRHDGQAQGHWSGCERDTAVIHPPDHLQPSGEPFAAPRHPRHPRGVRLRSRDCRFRRSGCERPVEDQTWLAVAFAADQHSAAVLDSTSYNLRALIGPRQHAAVDNRTVAPTVTSAHPCADLVSHTARTPSW
jgi:hypothetical protein